MDAIKEYMRIVDRLEHEEITLEEYEKLCEPLRNVVERKRGKWIPIKDDEHWYVLRWKCSCCGFWTTSDKMANYCEDCGADMRGEEDEQIR